MMSWIQTFREMIAPPLRAWAKRSVGRLDGLAEKLHTNPKGFFALPKVTVARAPIVLGMSLIVFVFGVLGLWAALAPLSAAAVARGVVVLDSNKKTIQHLEGGIVEKILVQEGSKVKAGDPLIELSETAARAKLDQIQGQLYAQQVTLARLIAERDGEAEIAFPAELLASTTPEILTMIETQRNVFAARRKAIEGNKAVLLKRIAQSKEEIAGLVAQEKSARDQRALLQEEATAVETLLKSGNAAKPRLLALQRAGADLQGKQGEFNAMIARAQQNITQTQIEIMNLDNDRMKEVNDAIRDTQVSIASLSEQTHGAQDVLTRLVIVAPQSGIVTGLKVHTQGGVIAPGETLMDIVPQDDTLIVEAQILPQDIDSVHAGLEARVRLSAYKSRNLNPVKGKLLSVSADRFEEKTTGQHYFLSRISVDQAELQHLKNVTLYPGMPVEVLIITGKRTVLSYLLSPITDSLFRGMREE